MLISKWSLINERSYLKNANNNKKKKTTKTKQTPQQTVSQSKCYSTLEQICERCKRSRELLLTQRHQANNSGTPTSQSDPICSAPNIPTKPSEKKNDLHFNLCFIKNASMSQLIFSNKDKKQACVSVLHFPRSGLLLAQNLFQCINFESFP